MASMGLSYAQVGKLFGFAKSTLSKWIRGQKLRKGAMGGEVLEMDGLWTRTREGAVEMKVIRDGLGNVMATFDSWQKAVNAAYMSGARSPRHIVSDGDLAIASAIDMTYGSQTNHQLCQFHLLREYLRNIGDAGFSEALKLLRSESVAQARIHAQHAVYLSEGEAEYWCEKALSKGLAHLVSGQSRYKTTSLLERLNRELRRRERMGTWWNPHNLLVLLQRRGLVTSTT